MLIKSGEPPVTPYIFKFENCWFQRPDLDEVVEKVWKKHYPGKTLLDKLQNKLRNLRKVLKGWNLNVEVVFRRQKKNLREEIDRLDKMGEKDSLDEEDRKYKKDCQNNLKYILKEEELKWLQRSHDKELFEGDSNTKYYHAKANGRFRKNRIVKLVQDEGVIEGQNDLKEYITKFYKNLFGEPEIKSLELDHGDVETLSEEEQKFLNRKFTMEELK